MMLQSQNVTLALMMKDPEKIGAFTNKSGLSSKYFR